MRTIQIDGELHLVLSRDEIVEMRFCIDGDSIPGKGAEVLPLPGDIPAEQRIKGEMVTLPCSKRMDWNLDY